MPPTRIRRIIRRTEIALAGIVLLPYGYISLALALEMAANAGWIPASAAARAFRAPLVW
jgi:hypothetical protein